MLLPQWLQQLAQRWSVRGGNRHRRSGRNPSLARRRVRPRLEVLEERLTPSTDVLAFSAASASGSFATGSIVPNQPSTAYSVQLQDSSGNAIAAASNVTIKLISNSSTGEFLDLSGKQLANSSLVIPAGSSFALFEYEDSQTGFAFITGQTSNASAFGGTAIEVQNVFAFTTPKQSLMPGQVSQPITIQMQDADGNPIKATSAVTVSLNSSSTGGKFLDTSGKPLTNNSLTIAAGSSSASFEYEDSNTGSPNISASTSTGAAGSQSVTVGYSLAFTTPVQSIATNQKSGAITVQLQDGKGNEVKAASTVTLNVNTFSGTGQFLDMSGNPLPKNTFGSTLTVAAGSSSASFEYEDSQKGIPTISVAVSNGTYSVGTSAQQQINVGQPLVITTPIQTLTPGQASQPITVQLDSPATSAVTLNLSSSSATGQFLDTSGTALTGNSITIAAGSNSASFKYQDSQAGLPTISIAKSDFSGFASQQENVGLSLNFTTGPQTVAQGQMSKPITIQLQDNKGQPFTPTATTYISLSSSNNGQFFDTSGKPLFNLTFAAGSSSATFEYQNKFSSGPDNVTASISGFGTSPLVSVSQQEIVTAPPYSLAIVSPTQTFAANQASQPLTVQLQKNGTTFTAASDVTITLSSSSSTGKFLDTSGKTLANDSITIAAGSSSASFAYEDSQEWFPTLTATVSGTVITGTQTENVGGVSFAFSTAAQTIKTGQASGAITVQFQDSSGKAVKAPSATTIALSSNSFTGQFLDSSGKALTNNFLSLAAGSSSGSFEFEDTVGGKPTLTAFPQTTTGSLKSATQQETVTGPYKIAFSASGLTVAPNQASQAITVQLQDSTNTAATTGSAVTVSLSSSSSTGKFLDTSGKALVNNSITIPAGSGTASFEYQDSQTGFPTLTASENGFKSQQTDNIGVSLVFTTSPLTVVAGKTSQTITVQLQDSSGKAFKAPSDMTVSLSSDRQGVQFLDTSGNPLTSTNGLVSVTIAVGSSSASFELTSTWGGSPTLTASTGYNAPGATPFGISATQKETVQGIANVVFTTSPQTVTAGQTSQLVTLQLEDNNGQIADAPSGGVSIDLIAGANTEDFLASNLIPTKFLDAKGNPLSSDPSDSVASVITIPAGSSTVSFEFQTSKAGSLPLSAIVTNGFLANQNETVQAASPHSVKFISPAQSQLVGTPSGTITVQLLDQFGNVIQASSGGLTFGLSSNSSSGKFLSVSGDSLASPSITIAQGASSASFEYEDNKAGTPTLTVTANGISNTQQLAITPTASEIHVTNTNDSGAGSLRDAIAAANNNSGSTIVFDSGVKGAIDLLTALPNITADTNILGPGANVLTLERSSSATDTFGGFVIGTQSLASEFGISLPPTVVTIGGLTVANFDGTGITNYGDFLTLRQMDVSNNQAASASQSTGSFTNFYGPPGGIGNFGDSTFGSGGSGTLTVLDSTIAKNSTTNSLVAAGINSEGGSVIIINSTIVGNVDNNSNSSGGVGIYGGGAYIGNSTISGNTATQQSTGFSGSNTSGGGIDSDGQVTLYDTIVAGNTGSPNNPTDVSGAFTSLGNNLIGTTNADSKGFIGSDLVGTTTKPIDPKLGALADNGGPTPTMALLTGSPAIAAGNSANTPAADQRGDARPQGAIDIGAVELTATSGPAAPTIAGNPITQSAVVGDNVSFTASANGNPTPTVQWQLSTDNGKTFNNISGATSTTLTLNNVALSMNNNEYRAVFTNTAGRVNTSAATLTVTEAAVAPSISGDPGNQTVTETTAATFTASANGSPTPNVQWQVSTDGGKTFTNISGATNTTLTLNNVTKTMSGNEYQAVFTNSSGSATTKAATLTVTSAVAPVITGNPSNQTATVGQSATFTASASGAPIPTVQWQVSTDGGKTFTNIGGATNTTLTLNNVTTAMSGDKYQAVFTNAGGSVTSTAASLTVHAAPPPPPPSLPTPVLQTPSLLQFLNSLFGGGTVTINADGTETVTDSFFGIPLIVSTFDATGKLVDATLFGIDITFLILLL